MPARPASTASRAVGGLADHVEVRLGVEDAANPAADQRPGRRRPAPGSSPGPPLTSAPGGGRATRKPSPWARPSSVAAVAGRPVRASPPGPDRRRVVAVVRAARPSSTTSTTTASAGQRTRARPSAGPACLQGVGQRLLDDPVRREVDARGQLPASPSHGEVDGEARGRQLGPAGRVTQPRARSAGPTAGPGRRRRVLAERGEQPAQLGQGRAAGPLDGAQALRGGASAGSLPPPPRPAPPSRRRCGRRRRALAGDALAVLGGQGPRFRRPAAAQVLGLLREPEHQLVPRPHHPAGGPEPGQQGHDERGVLERAPVERQLVYATTGTSRSKDTPRFAAACGRRLCRRRPASAKKTPNPSLVPVTAACAATSARTVSHTASGNRRRTVSGAISANPQAVVAPRPAFPRCGRSRPPSRRRRRSRRGPGRPSPRVGAGGQRPHTVEHLPTVRRIEPRRHPSRRRPGAPRRHRTDVRRRAPGGRAPAYAVPTVTVPTRPRRSPCPTRQPPIATPRGRTPPCSPPWRSPPRPGSG